MKFSNESHRAAQWHTNIQWKKPRDHPPTLCRQILSDNSNNKHFHLRAEEHPSSFKGRSPIRIMTTRLCGLLKRIILIPYRVLANYNNTTVNSHTIKLRSRKRKNLRYSCCKCSVELNK